MSKEVTLCVRFDHKTPHLHIIGIFANKAKASKEMYADARTAYELRTDNSADDLSSNELFRVLMRKYAVSYTEWTITDTEIIGDKDRDVEIDMIPLFVAFSDDFEYMGVFDSYQYAEARCLDELPVGGYLIFEIRIN
jgi:hypothetical protein